MNRIAQGCGISTVLITFCLEESELHNVNSNTFVNSYINKKFGPNRKTVEIMTRGCTKVYSQLQIAPSPKAGNLLSAALRANGKYDKFLFFTEDKGTKIEREFFWMNTYDAKRSFDKSTGMIKDKLAWGKNWWVCQSIKGFLSITIYSCKAAS